MKKFVFCFVCYIGCLLINFNLASAADDVFLKSTKNPSVNVVSPVPTSENQAATTDMRQDDVSEDAQALSQKLVEKSDVTHTKQAPAPKKKRVSTLKRITAEVYKLFLVPFVIDKLYPDTEIKKDITETLAQIYPTASREKLKTLGKYIRYFVSGKRRYEYAIHRLEQQIKAFSILPQDAPIVAEEGEFATAYSDDRKQTDSDEYQVKYNPYKYLEYDKGELGEPVRRRDKNYQEKIRNVDEIILAILKFDIKGFVKALQKIPAASDGSNEKPVKLDNGVQARLLLAHSAPGELEKIRGVIDVYVPQGYYINGDFLNPAVQPQFFLSEDKDNELNITKYQLFLPEASSVVKDGQTKRILTHHVRYPIEFTRQDTTKPMKIKGNFIFMVCDKDHTCAPMKTEHELTLHPSEYEELSLYYNYVTQGFTHLPAETAKHAKLNSAVYDAATNMLSLNFKTSRAFSQAAVMVEDAVGTNFINPQYLISEDNVTVTFEATTPTHAENAQTTRNGNSAAPVSGNVSVPQEIAVTAMFDGAETMRKVVAPTVTPAANGVFSPIEVNSAVAISLWTAFLFGLCLNFMPGVFYLFVRLVNILWTREDRFKIFLYYALGVAVGLLSLGLLFHRHYWSVMYETAFLTALSAIIVVSFLCECLNLMDFALFRPFRGKIHRGFFGGFFSVVLLSSFPMFLAPEFLSNALNVSGFQLIKYFAVVWLGIIALPLFAMVFPLNRPVFLPAMQRLNIIYNFIYLIGIFWLLIFLRGTVCFWLVLICLCLVFGLWYIYLPTVEDVIIPIRAKKKQQQLFYQMQRNMFAVLCLLSLMTYGAIALFPVKQAALQAPTPVEIMQQAENTDKPILVSINSPWMISGISNNFYKEKFAKDKIQIIYIEVLGEAKAAAPWFAYYNQRYAPLNVLFNSRHPKGLKLPSILQNINWEQAFELFEDAQPSTERIQTND